MSAPGAAHAPPLALPPALTSLATVLELAQGFALAFVTGPRDHRDSVYLRLVRALGDRYEFVRHRLDRDGLALFDVISCGADDRPRVVFLSGLESMSDETRRDVTARLNLVRDAWAPHPARIVFWLPSWGLAEFRRLAPDLFHWRSNLTALHDADLPVRDELEYLVWACERYRTISWAFDASIELLASELATYKRDIVLGYSAEERRVVLHFIALVAASLRLAATVRADARTRDALDVLSSSSRIFRRPRPHVFPPAPLLLRATDLAGRLEPEPSWDTLTRAARIPGDEGAASTLSSLCARSELLVLLDGVDQLALTPGSPAERLLSWLGHGPSALLLLAAKASLPPVLASWNLRHLKHLEPLAQDRSPDATARLRLARLLQHLFPGSELRLLCSHLFGPELAAQLPTRDTDSELAAHFIVICERRGLLDAAFFAELQRIRPSRARDIDAAARAWLGA